MRYTNPRLLYFTLCLLHYVLYCVTYLNLVYKDIYTHGTCLSGCRAVGRCHPSRTVPCNSPSSDPSRTVPCNSPSSDDARDFRSEFCCSIDPCDCPSMTEVTHGFSRRSSRRTASAPPTRRPHTGCANSINFESGFLRRESDCDCIETEPRPPFVVRRVIPCH